MITVEQIYNLLNEKFPFDTQENWDNSGILINSQNRSDSVLVCLDVTKEAINMAKEIGAKIIVSHHPVIFSPLKYINNEDIVYSLIKNDISVISAHTNFDKYEFGTSYAIADSLNLEIEDSEIEIGVIAQVDLTTEELGKKCKEVFGIAECTLPYKEVRKVFICAGSGSGMKDEVINSGADCLITGECKYHDMLDLSQIGISTITVGHDASESISLSTMADIIKNQFKDIKVEVFTSDNLQHHI